MQWPCNGAMLILAVGLFPCSGALQIKAKLKRQKNNKSRRVDTSKRLKYTLIDLRHQRKSKPIKKGWGQIPQWNFINSKGNLLDANTGRRRVFYTALEKAELRKIRIHDLRHTYASMLLEANESIAYIRDQLGHHSIKVAVDIYDHLTRGGNKDAVDRLDDGDFFANPDAPYTHPCTIKN